MSYHAQYWLLYHHHHHHHQQLITMECTALNKLTILGSLMIESIPLGNVYGKRENVIMLPSRSSFIWNFWLSENETIQRWNEREILFSLANCQFVWAHIKKRFLYNILSIHQNGITSPVNLLTFFGIFHSWKMINYIYMFSSIEQKLQIILAFKKIQIFYSKKKSDLIRFWLNKLRLSMFGWTMVEERT
jgi:hypothetical protein